MLRPRLPNSDRQNSAHLASLGPDLVDIELGRDRLIHLRPPGHGVRRCQHRLHVVVTVVFPVIYSAGVPAVPVAFRIRHIRFVSIAD